MRPNVMATCMDTFRTDMGGAGGDLSFVETPYLDRLRLDSFVVRTLLGRGRADDPGQTLHVHGQALLSVALRYSQ